MDGKSFVAGMAVGAAVLVAGLFLGGAAQGQAQGQPAPADGAFKTLTVSTLNVVNGRGEVVATVGSNNVGGEVRVLNNAGQPVAGIGTRGGGGEVAVADRKGTQRVRIADDGTIEIYGDDKKVRLRMAGYKSDGNSRSEFSGQVIAFDRNESVVEKLPR